MAIIVIRDWDDNLRNPNTSSSSGNRTLSSLLPLLLHQHDHQKRLQQHQQQQQQQQSGDRLHRSVEKSDDFIFSLDVQHFAPEEIQVKVADDHIIIEAEHVDRPDEHGYISRYFKRRCRIPDGFDKEAIMSKLSSDGILTVRAPKIKKEEEPKERVIPIVQTGPLRAVTAEEGEEKQVKNKL